MIIRLILWLSIVWLPPLMLLILRNETKFKKNIAMGVTLPLEGRRDGEVLACLDRFKKQSALVCLILTAVAAPCIFVEDFMLNLLLWGFWLLAAVAAPYVPYVLCNRDLKRIKKSRGWSFSTPNVVTVDLTSIPEDKKLSPLWFVIALLISLGPLLLDTGFALIYVVDSASIPLFYACFRYLYRNKAERVDDNLELTLVLSRIRRKAWSTVWLCASFSFAILNWGIYLTQNSPGLMLLLIFGVCTIMTFALLRVELHTRKMQEKLTQNSGEGSYMDDDDKWLGGIMYYNPNDSKLFVNDRVGVNVSVNLAKTSGKIMMALVALMLIAIPFTGPVIIGAVDKPPTLVMNENSLTAESGRLKIEIGMDEIAELQLLSELPENPKRTNGTGMENLLKGQFSCKEFGKLTLCLDPTVQPFILITTKDNTLYLIGDREEGVTAEIYESLIKAQGQ